MQKKTYKNNDTIYKKSKWKDIHKAKSWTYKLEKTQQFKEKEQKKFNTKNALTYQDTCKQNTNTSTKHIQTQMHKHTQIQ